MSIEHIGEIEDIKEEERTFEQLEYTRDFGIASAIEVKNILKENFEYWRLPTLAELYALYRQNKKKFFTHKSYWATSHLDKNVAHDLREFKTGFMGPAWFFERENEECPKNLVLFKKGTHIGGNEEEIKNIEETYPF